MIRRSVLGHGLMLLGFGRGAWAQPSSASVRYSPLTRPVRLPLDALTIPWQPVPFTAETVSPRAAATPGQRVLLSGMLFRKTAGDDRLERFSALCLTCPHEQCLVDFITDRARLVKMKGAGATDPLFECGCHFSVFDALADGERVAGPTARGLYRFRMNLGADAAIVVDAIEEEAML
jgi:Rieske Fe-S protein